METSNGIVDSPLADTVAAMACRPPRGLLLVAWKVPSGGDAPLTAVTGAVLPYGRTCCFG